MSSLATINVVGKHWVVSRAIQVLSTENGPRQVMSHRDRTFRNLEGEPSVSAASMHVAARDCLKGARCGLGQFSF
ncbi:MAG: hypothetical protein MUC83_01595 [Pirellula sp.]|nr:hypothetical protein [Pirellula sp.]